jgi:hypothetical protein
LNGLIVLSPARVGEAHRAASALEEYQSQLVFQLLDTCLLSGGCAQFQTIPRWYGADKFGLGPAKTRCALAVGGEKKYAKDGVQDTDSNTGS